MTKAKEHSVIKPQFKQLSKGLLSHHCDSDVETTLPIQDLVTNIVSCCAFICFFYKIKAGISLSVPKSSGGKEHRCLNLLLKMIDSCVLSSVVLRHD